MASIFFFFFFFFASQAGASCIVGIDNSEIVYTAMDIVRKNNVKNVELVKGRLEDTELPEAKYDIIISEWMGYFLLYESMLDSIIYAREHHLNPNGIILPNRCSLSLMGYGNDKLYAEQVEFWSDVYGVNMRDLAKRSPNGGSPFSLKCTQAGRLSAFVGFFDTFFELPREVMFSTSPYHTTTHWKQTVFFIDQPQEVSWGDVIKGKIISRRNTTDVRALNVEIQVFGKTYKYTVD
ncbi:GL12503 [Drosophila persimilis]|uniref:GL12503 n=1 Tax=Drosophila persimilis TaxID=7234 RepID=B4GL48_DROPE|nr:GL12503 [Drosophila persimilis]